jgi:cytochrome c556
MTKKPLLLASLLGTLMTSGTSLAAEPGEQPATDLKTIMVGLGEQMARAQAAVWVDDFAEIQAAASAVADHPKVSAGERVRVVAAIGAEFPNFVAADRAVHDAGIRLAEAAAAEDMDRTLRELTVLQTSCVACHTQFRQGLAK